MLARAPAISKRPHQCSHQERCCIKRHGSVKGPKCSLNYSHNRDRCCCYTFAACEQAYLTQLPEAARAHCTSKPLALVARPGCLHPMARASASVVAHHPAPSRCRRANRLRISRGLPRSCALTWAAALFEHICALRRFDKQRGVASRRSWRRWAAGIIAIIDFVASGTCGNPDGRNPLHVPVLDASERDQVAKQRGAADRRGE